MKCADMPPDHTMSDHFRQEDWGRPIEDHPPPKAYFNRPAIWELVIDDMRNRDHVGRQRYGTPLQAHNGRDALVDAYRLTSERR